MDSATSPHERPACQYHRPCLAYPQRGSLIIQEWNGHRVNNMVRTSKRTFHGYQHHPDRAISVYFCGGF